MEPIIPQAASGDAQNETQFQTPNLNQESPVRARTGDSWSGINLIFWEPKAVAAGALGKFA